jgi:hypothetical protein
MRYVKNRVPENAKYFLYDARFFPGLRRRKRGSFRARPNILLTINTIRRIDNMLVRTGAQAPPPLYAIESETQSWQDLGRATKNLSFINGQWSFGRGKPMARAVLLEFGAVEVHERSANLPSPQNDN